MRAASSAGRGNTPVSRERDRAGWGQLWLFELKL